MATARIEKQWSPCATEYILDTEADVANLPACCPGSTAVVVASGTVYMVNASGVWTKFGGGA